MVSRNNDQNNGTCGAGGSAADSVSPEDVCAWKERLWESLAAFEAVQMEHCKAFAAGSRDHLMARRAEREKALARLQMALEAAQPEWLVGQDSDDVNRLRAMFSTLIEHETALADMTLRIQKQMADELAAMRRGRRALKGYSQHHGHASRPRFLNSKT